MSTPLGVSEGGTGRDELDSGRLLLGAGTNPVSLFVGSSSGQVPVWNSQAGWQSGELQDIAGRISYAQLPNVSGAWDVGASNTLDIQAQSSRRVRLTEFDTIELLNEIDGFTRLAVFPDIVEIRRNQPGAGQSPGTPLRVLRANMGSAEFRAGLHLVSATGSGVGGQAGLGSNITWFASNESGGDSTSQLGGFGASWLSNPSSSARRTRFTLFGDNGGTGQEFWYRWERQTFYPAGGVGRDLGTDDDPWRDIYFQVSGVGARRIEVGDADSAGAGFRTVRVEN